MKVIYWQINLRLSQIFKAILVVFAVLFVQFFGYINVLPAQADTVITPEAKYYNAQPSEKDKQLIDNAKKNLEDIGENIREKLNLDEPLPESTKEFLNSSENKVDEVVNLITRESKGYYEENK
jgi:ABC-type dipeptide/oligopeptide/nickel transport system permease component